MLAFSTEECTKRRLTERAELMVAVEFLARRGLAMHEIPVQLTRFYYVDVDTLNEVIDEMETPAFTVTEFRQVA